MSTLLSPSLPAGGHNAPESATASGPVFSRGAKLGLALAGGLALALASTLWLQFGGGVFFDMLAASFIGCFF